MRPHRDEGPERQHLGISGPLSPGSTFSTRLSPAALQSLWAVAGRARHFHFSAKAVS